MKYVLDSHTHTIASGHAYNTILEMAQAAAAKNLELLAITEHAMNMPGTAHEYYFANLKVLPRQMEGIEVLFGTEANLLDYDGTLDMSQSLLQEMDVVIASMHIPCVTPGSKKENTRAYLKAMENPLVNIIGHPDDGRYEVDYKILVKEAKEHGVLLEINNNSLNPSGFRKNTRENDLEMMKWCMKYETPVIVNSDSHCIWDIARREFAEEVIRSIDFPEELIVNRSVQEYKKFVNRFKK